MILRRFDPIRPFVIHYGLLSILLAGAWLLLSPLVATNIVHAQTVPPTFGGMFSPSTIGPGSTSTLEFTINNNSGVGIENLAFSNTLQASITIASPAGASTTCEGTLTAPDGGATISLSGGRVGKSDSCTVSVNVTSSAVGTHTNTSGDLTSDAGNSGTATADLTVATDRPGFSKAFSPSSVVYGGRSTLTFTIDNTANLNRVGNLDFTDNLPLGLVIADPANASTNCISPTNPDTTITAIPGSNVIALDANGNSILAGYEVLAAGTTCTVTVDVAANGSGILENVTDNLLADFVESGKANAALEVTVAEVYVSKSFIDDPVGPGDTVTLEFTIGNLNRSTVATDISFTDDLDAILSGLVATNLPATPCGPLSSLTGSDVLTLTGGELEPDPAGDGLAPGAACVFSATLQVPAGAATGEYLNSTSALSANIGGNPVSGLAAEDTLFVEPSPPRLTMEFTNDPVNKGGVVTLVLTVENPNSSSMTDLSFVDNLPAILATASGPVGTTCVGGTATFTPLINPPAPSDAIPANVSLSGGSLNAGESCTVNIELDVSDEATPGNYVNTTEKPSATIDGIAYTGKTASDALTVVGAPQLLKSFIDDPVAPGGTVTLEFTLRFPDDAAALEATEITFSDDLSAALAGLEADGLPQNGVCGTGSELSGTSTLTLTGGSLTGGETSCTFSVTLQVPANAPSGSYANTTSPVSATVAGVTGLTSAAASDELTVATISLTKSFLQNPALPGDTIDLEFTIENLDSAPVTGVTFSDDLNAAVPGMTATSFEPASDPCGPGSSFSGPNSLVLANGNLGANASCTFTATMLVPAATAAGQYNNITSGLVATDRLTVIEPLVLTKSFVDAPVAPSELVELVFTLTNNSAILDATAIAFSDDLDAVLSGLVADSFNGTCGGSLSGTTALTFSNGFVAAGGACTMSAFLRVPFGADAGTYINTTSDVDYQFDGTPHTGDAAVADLGVISLATITVIKQTVPADDPTSFDFTLAGGPNEINEPFTLNARDEPSRTFSVSPGIFSLNETSLPNGWNLDHVTCDNGDLPDAVTLALNGEVTCTFVNNRVSEIVFVKEVTGGGSPDDWTFAISDTVHSGIGNGGVIILDLGEYEVVETGPEDYAAVGASGACALVDGKIILTALAIADTCTIVNAKQVSDITFIKGLELGGADSSEWAFTVTSELPDPILPTGIKSGDIVELELGVYGVTESGPVDYVLAGASGACSVDGGEIVLTVGGVDAVCTITNTKKTGDITFAKVVAGGDATSDDWTFDVTGDGEGADLPADIPSGDSRIVPFGVYTVTESGPDGYTPWEASGACALIDGKIVLTVADAADTCTVVNADSAQLSVLENCLVAGEKDVKVEEDSQIACSLYADEKIELKKATTVQGDVTARSKEIKVDEQASIEGDLHSDDKVELEKNVTVTGSVWSGDDVKLEEGVLVTGDVTAAKSVEVKNGATVNGAINQNAAVDPVPAPLFPTVEVTAGGDDVKPKNGETVSLMPGSYGKLDANDDVTINLAAGDYAFEEFKVEKNATIDFATGGGAIIVSVENKVEFKEGLIMTGAAENVLFQVEGSDEVKFGKQSIVIGTYVAPDGKITLEANTQFTGLLLGKEIEVKEENVVIGEPAVSIYFDLYIASLVGAGTTLSDQDEAPDQMLFLPIITR